MHPGVKAAPPGDIPNAGPGQQFWSYPASAVGIRPVKACNQAERGTGDTRFDPALDGGALMDVGCYCISGVRLVAGEPVRARGEQVAGPSGVDVIFTGALSFADGVLGHFDCGFIVPRRAMLEVVGEEATILVPDPFTPRTPGLEVLRPGAEPEKIPIEPANSYRLELENVSAAIRGEAPLLLGREDAVGQARTIDALYRSAAAG